LPITEEMRERLHWDDARVFLAIARNGTLSAAATALDTGVATVARRIERLEPALGVPLFSRHQSGYQLTDEGAALIERAEALEYAGHSFGEVGASQMAVAGRVRLATAESLANDLIIPSIPALLKQYPKLSIEVITDIRTVNLHQRDADLAVRMVKPSHGNVTIRQIGLLAYGVYGSREYLQSRASVSDAAHFEGDAFIGWTEQQSDLPSARWLESVLQGRPCVLTTTSLAGQVSAARAGLGLAVLPHFLARPAGLVCLLNAHAVDQSVWLVMHSNLKQSPRIRAVADHLTALLLGHGALLTRQADV